MAYKFNKIDYFNIILLLLSLLSYMFNSAYSNTILWLFIIFTSLRVLILLKRKILWKTRNRLVFSGLFFVITPLFFMTILFSVVAVIMMGQYAITIVNNMMELQIKSLENNANRNLERLKIANNSGVLLNKELEWIKKKYNNRNDGRYVVIVMKAENDKKIEVLAKPRNYFEIEKLKKTNKLRGYFFLNNELYLGVMKKNKDFRILTAVKLEQKFFTDFVSKIGDFTIKFRIPIRKNGIKQNLIVNNNEYEKDEQIKLEIPIHYRYQYMNFNKKNFSKKSIGVFIINLDIKKMYYKWKKGQPFMDDGNIVTVLYTLVAILGILIITSFLVGLKILRVITKSINQLTKGTHKIRNGDFSFRIRMKSKDQLQYLAESFNEMAAGIDRLLVEENEKHRLEEELRIARSIQEKLLPDENFNTDEFEISAINIPAEEIAGDYFDYYYKKDDFLMLIIADVSGKGASAAFYMAELKGVNNHLRKTDMSPSSLISEFHYSLNNTFDKVTFITISIAKFIISEREFVFSRAGHTKGLFYNSLTNECIELSPDGVAIGIPYFSKNKIQEITIKYNSGDVLVLFSDGLSEIMNKKNEMFDIEHIKHVLKENNDKSAEVIKENILKSSEAFAQNIPNQDDLTLLILKVK